MRLTKRVRAGISRLVRTGITGSSVKRRRTTDLSDMITTDGDIVSTALKHVVPLMRICEALRGGGMRIVMALKCDLRSTGGTTVDTMHTRLTGGSRSLTGRLSGLKCWESVVVGKGV